MKKLIAILDLQFGSTGKGNVAAYIGQEEQPDTIVTAWAPNAGHTSILKGLKMINTQLANGIQSPRMSTLLIGPGSVFNATAFLGELVYAYNNGVKPFDIYVHPQASILLPEDAKAESEHLFKIGSTMKGSMNALARKLARTHKFGTVNQVMQFAMGNKPMAEIMEALGRIMQVQEAHGADFRIDKEAYQIRLKKSEVLMIEGCQGYSLGINSGFYPYCTSRECTLSQALTDCAIPFQEYVDRHARIIGVARTYPIRVANRFDEDGKQVGTSGPCYPDQRELTWADLGRDPELTTVTKLPRRVFTFSQYQIEDAIRANACTEVFLTFADYVSDMRLTELVDMINRSAGFKAVTHCAFGPRSDHDIREFPYTEIPLQGALL